MLHREGQTPTQGRAPIINTIYFPNMPPMAYPMGAQLVPWFPPYWAPYVIPIQIQWHY